LQPPDAFLRLYTKNACAVWWLRGSNGTPPNPLAEFEGLLCGRERGKGRERGEKDRDGRRKPLK